MKDMDGGYRWGVVDMDGVEHINGDDGGRHEWGWGIWHSFLNGGGTGLEKVSYYTVYQIWLIYKNRVN